MLMYLDRSKFIGAPKDNSVYFTDWVTVFKWSFTLDYYF